MRQHQYVKLGVVKRITTKESANFEGNRGSWQSNRRIPEEVQVSSLAEVKIGRPLLSCGRTPKWKPFRQEDMLLRSPAVIEFGTPPTQFGSGQANSTSLSPFRFMGSNGEDGHVRGGSVNQAADRAGGTV